MPLSRDVATEEVELFRSGNFVDSTSAAYPASLLFFEIFQEVSVQRPMAYAMEELRAELASAFVATELGIPTDIPQHSSYIANWIKPLKEDKREIFRAAADAQRIADMQLGFHPDYAAQLDQPATPAPVRAIYGRRLTAG